MNYARFINRLIAFIIDGLLLGAIYMVIILIFREWIAALLGNLVAIAYFSYFESSEKQATIGKALMKIKVTDREGGRITMAKAVVRSIGKYISGAIFCIGYIIALFTERKQALHDIIADTLVVEGVVDQDYV